MFRLIKIIFITCIFMGSSASSSYYSYLSKDSNFSLPKALQDCFKLSSFSAEIFFILMEDSQAQSIPKQLKYLEGDLYLDTALNTLKLYLYDSFFSSDKLSKPIFDFLFLKNSVHFYINSHFKEEYFFSIQDYREIPNRYKNLLWISIPHFVHLLFFKDLFIQNPDHILYDEEIDYKKIVLIRKPYLKEELFFPLKKANLLEKRIFEDLYEKIQLHVEYKNYFITKNFKIPSHIEFSNGKIKATLILSDIKAVKEFQAEIFQVMKYSDAKKIHF